MSLFNTEKLQNAQKANLDLLQQISGKVFASVEQLSQLQFKTLRASTEEYFDGFRKLLAVRDPQGFAELQASFIQPHVQAERLAEFNRQMQELIVGTQSEIAKLTEGQVEAGTQQVQEFIEVMSKNAPAGSEPVVAAFKSTLANAGSVYENAQKAAKQAADIAQSGFTAATTAAGKAAPGKAAGGSK
ncbi:MAG: phasin family protein [Pseudomonas sp.]|jgi:phasin family protein|uniref:phasin family protein n=1 Tax=unclassified Pseudomonas TaxID=196821 RepID=UPI001C55B59C|nr:MULTISPECIES: phasin family protein [unclassified Pseudomonas]MEB0006085.1 phasin family protein [Pseudomonas sp. RTB2]MEB0018348.1 phasin family protein [Pseudomonas sp. RTB3]MEB0150607.1 phasin family protein [Pseudomonas sp. CCC2.2]MEB0268383.1 phasin family protein [Pseudomonas sp. 5B4]